MSDQYDPEALRSAEEDIRERLRGHAVDLDVQEATSNLYRAATVLSRSAEKEILADEDLSWSGFTVLWVLWVWGEMGSTRLASELGLTMGTLTGVRKGLEAQSLVETRPDSDDGRRRLISLTTEGAEVIERTYPRFNLWAKELFGDLSAEEVRLLSGLLQTIIVAPSRRS